MSSSEKQAGLFRVRPFNADTPYPGFTLEWMDDRGTMKEWHTIPYTFSVEDAYDLHYILSRFLSDRN